MKKPIFINKDPQALKETLQKLGKPLIKEALKGRDLETPRELEKFRLHWNGGRASLEYAYSTYAMKNQYTHIMMVPNDDLPEKGWEIEWYRY